jgi:hypothetical protein
VVCREGPPAGINFNGILHDHRSTAVNTPEARSATHHPATGTQLARGDVAQWIVAQLDSDGQLHHAVALWWVPRAIVQRGRRAVTADGAIAVSNRVVEHHQHRRLG